MESNIEDNSLSRSSKQLLDLANVRSKWPFKWISETMSFNVCQYSDKEKELKTFFGIKISFPIFLALLQPALGLSRASISIKNRSISETSRLKLGNEH